MSKALLSAFCFLLAATASGASLNIPSADGPLTINGAEAAALDGARETLRGLRPRVRLAGWYKIDGVAVAAHAASRLEAAGYRTFIGPRGNVLGLPLVSG